MNLSCHLALCCHVALLSAATSGATVRFGGGENSFEIEFVLIGSPGNPDDLRIEYPFDESNFIGGVNYTYGIGKFEVTCEILNKIGNSGGFPVGTDNYCRFRSGPKSPGAIEIDNARLIVNWLNTSSGFEPAYKDPFLLMEWGPGDIGYDPENTTRNSLASFFLPTGDEFHKAAYYDPVTETYLDYATGSNVKPRPVAGGTEANTAVFDRVLLPSGHYADVDNAGGLSAFGTMGQLGNMSEWEESAIWFNGGQENIIDPLFSFTRQRDDITGGRGFRVVMLDLTPLLDCSGNGLIDDSDLPCANQAGTIDHLLEELRLDAGDLNADGFVDFADFLILSSNFGQDLNDYTKGDINGDGTVNFSDFLILSVNFEGAEAAAVPEPASLVWMGLTFLNVVRRLRSRRVS